MNELLGIRGGISGLSCHLKMFRHVDWNIQQQPSTIVFIAQITLEYCNCERDCGLPLPKFSGCAKLGLLTIFFALLSSITFIPHMALCNTAGCIFWGKKLHESRFWLRPATRACVRFPQIFAQRWTQLGIQSPKIRVPSRYFPRSRSGFIWALVVLLTMCITHGGFSH